VPEAIPAAHILKAKEKVLAWAEDDQHHSITSSKYIDKIDTLGFGLSKARYIKFVSLLRGLDTR